MEDMRQKLLQQTGPMFSSFDAAIKESVQADLDMISPLTSVFDEKDSEEIFREMEEVVVDNFVNRIFANSIRILQPPENSFVGRLKSSLSKPRPFNIFSTSAS